MEDPRELEFFGPRIGQIEALHEACTRLHNDVVAFVRKHGEQPEVGGFDLTVKTLNIGLGRGWALYIIVPEQLRPLVLGPQVVDQPVTANLCLDTTPEGIDELDEYSMGLVIGTNRIMCDGRELDDDEVARLGSDFNTIFQEHIKSGNGKRPNLRSV
jgi:hypothetical protein